MASFSSSLSSSSRRCASRPGEGLREDPAEAGLIEPPRLLAGMARACPKAVARVRNEGSGRRRRGVAESTNRRCRVRQLAQAGQQARPAARGPSRFKT